MNNAQLSGYTACDAYESIANSLPDKPFTIFNVTLFTYEWRDYCPSSMVAFY